MLCIFIIYVTIYIYFHVHILLYSSDLPLAHTTPEEYQAITQLSDPIQLLFFQSLLHIMIEETFVLQIEEIEDETKRSDDPIVDIKVINDTTLHEVLNHPFTDTILGKIFPLFGISVFKSPRKAGYAHYALRHKSKMMRVSQLLQIIRDLALIFHLPKAIGIDEIIHRWLLTISASFVHSYPELYPNLWYDVSMYNVHFIPSDQHDESESSSKDGMGNEDHPTTTATTTYNDALANKPRSLQQTLDLLLDNILFISSSNPTENTPSSSSESTTPPQSNSIGISIEQAHHLINITNIPSLTHGECVFLAPIIALRVIQVLVANHVDVSGPDKQQQTTVDLTQYTVELLQFVCFASVNSDLILILILTLIDDIHLSISQRTHH